MKPTSLRDMICQLVFPRLGSNLHPNVSADDHASEIEALVAEYPVGGLVLFNGSLALTPATLSRIQKISSVPLLIASDIERGVGQQLRGATVFPHAMAYDSLASDALAYDTLGVDPGEARGNIDAAVRGSARIIAREALSAGIQIAFSPVADVHSNPKNPIISLRAFGIQPVDVARRVRSYIKGCHEIGLLTTAKHFPGHGDTDSDSHETVPVVDKSRCDLESVELIPFKAAVAEHVDLVMTAHVAYPALDAKGAIATASKPILDDLLRKKLGFEGVVISDSLLMVGADRTDGAPKLAELLNAGVDILLDVADPREAIDRLVDDVRDGRISRDRILDAFDRVWGLKRQLLCRFGPLIFSNPERLIPISKAEYTSNQTYSDQIAASACRVRKGSLSKVELNRTRIQEYGLCVIHIGPEPTYSDPTLGDVEAVFREMFGNVYFYTMLRKVVEDGEAPEIPTENLKQARRCARVIVLITAKPAAWQQFGVSERQGEFARSLAMIPGTILVFSGAPVENVGEENVVVSFSLNSDSAPSMRALVRILSDISVNATLS